MGAVRPPEREMLERALAALDAEPGALVGPERTRPVSKG